MLVRTRGKESDHQAHVPGWKFDSAGGAALSESAQRKQLQRDVRKDERQSKTRRKCSANKDCKNRTERKSFNKTEKLETTASENDSFDEIETQENVQDKNRSATKRSAKEKSAFRYFPCNFGKQKPSPESAIDLQKLW